MLFTYKNVLYLKIIDLKECWRLLYRTQVLITLFILAWILNDFALVQ